MSSKQESSELLSKIKSGLQLAIRRLYEQKAANNEMAVICENGEIKHIPASELLKKHKK
jgi:hypothetical protein